MFARVDKRFTYARRFRLCQEHTAGPSAQAGAAESKERVVDVVGRRRGVGEVKGIDGCLFGNDAERRRGVATWGGSHSGPACDAFSLPHNNCPRLPLSSLCLASPSLTPTSLSCQTIWAGAVASMSVASLSLSLTRGVATAGEAGRKQTAAKPGP